MLLERFLCLGREIVFSAESLCDTSLCRLDPSPMNRLAPARNPYKYLNAGLFVGRARSLKWFFAQTMKILQPDMDDQHAYAQVYLQFPERVVLDHDSLLFGVLPPSSDLLDAHWIIPGVDVLSNVTLAELDLSALRRRSSPNACGFGGPVAFHFAGMRYEYNPLQRFNPCQVFLAELYNGIGANKQLNAQHQRVVISLTTTPPRLKNLRQTLNSLLNQTLTPAAIYLNVPWRSTRLNQVYEIPPAISSLPIIINRCDDFGPASKLIPTLEREQHPDTLIITVDDDMIYPPSLVQDLVELHSVWPHAAFGFAGQLIDLQPNFPPIVRSADKYVNQAAAVDILEAFLGAIYLRSWFDDEIKKIPSACWRTDDIWISYNLAKKDIARIKVQGKERAVLSPNDAIAPLREGNVYALRKNDECAQYLLPGFTRGWTAEPETCPVVFQKYYTPPLDYFPLRNPFYRETSTSPCNTPVYVPLSPRTHQMFVAQYMGESGVLSSPSNKYQISLLSSGQLCVTGPGGSHSICYPGEPQPIGNYFTALQEDGNLCTYRGSSPLNRGQGGPIFCSGTSVDHFQLILRVDDDGDFGVFDLLNKSKVWGGKF
eukprot:TRINITY_DN7924_c0_g1_i27.p1 TRINITY_DN7924_c0_g1~~TRINITY_DN7924_c0_g1_i27.p1  ORF type:complete len:599 (+),score=23.17 TRINITY_DN7924_c0_g1_i27:83-1879(+)